MGVSRPKLYGKVICSNCSKRFKPDVIGAEKCYDCIEKDLEEA